MMGMRMYVVMTGSGGDGNGKWIEGGRRLGVCASAYVCMFGSVCV